MGLGGPRTHHLDGGLAHATIMGAAGRFPINGDLLGGQDGVDRLHPTQETRFKLLGV